MSRAKFSNLPEAFEDIRKNPLNYLPEKNLFLFRAFWDAYAWRVEGELLGNKFWSFLSKFHKFVDEKYKNQTVHGAFNVIYLYSRNQSEAFDRFFELLDEFKNANKIPEQSFEKNVELQPVNFYELLKAMLQRPALYIGSNSFTLLASFLSGWFRAVKDFNLEATDEEKTFIKFQKYIEEKGLPLPSPPWNKIVWYKSMSEEESLKLFSEWIDEFAFQGKNSIEYIEFHWKLRNGWEISDLIDLES